MKFGCKCDKWCCQVLLCEGLVIVYRENMYVMGCIFLAVEKGKLSVLAISLQLNVMSITFWFNACSIIKLYFSSTFLEGFYVSF